MQDGSSIDLSAKTGVWSAYFSLTDGGNRTTKFAPDASVAILLGSRTPALGEKIVSWPTAAKPDSSVSLTNGTYVLRPDPAGRPFMVAKGWKDLPGFERFLVDTLLGQRDATQSL